VDFVRNHTQLIPERLISTEGLRYLEIVLQSSNQLLEDCAAYPVDAPLYGTASFPDERNDILVRYRQIQALKNMVEGRQAKVP
jgi:hypothetical protein